MKHYMQACFSSLVMIMVIAAASEGICRAGKISDFDYLMKTEYSAHQGMVTSISPAGDYVIVSERKIWFVETLYNGSTFATEVHDSDGSLIDMSRLKRGDWVYVFGGGRRNNEIAAKDIFILPGKLSEKDFNDFTRTRSLRTWKSEIRPR